MTSSAYRDLVLFLVLAAIWGTAFVAIKEGLTYFPPVTFAALRYEIAGVLMLGYTVWVTEQPVPRTRGEWLLVGVTAVFMIGAYHAFLFLGENRAGVTSAVAAVIVSLSPILTTAFARVLLPDEGLTVTGVAGLLIGFLGVIVLVNPDPQNLAGEGTVGKLLVLAASTAFAFGSVLTRRIDARLEIETMESWAMLVGGLLMHGLGLALGESMQEIEITGGGLAALGYLAVVASAIGFLIYFDLLDRLGPVEINLVSYVAPVFAALSAWLLFARGVSRATLAGFGLIFCGFLLIKREAIEQRIQDRQRQAAD